MSMLTPNQQKSSKNQQKQEKEKLTGRSEWETHNKHTWSSSPAQEIPLSGSLLQTMAPSLCQKTAAKNATLL